jgi:putative oxidoreductase
MATYAAPLSPTLPTRGIDLGLALLRLGVGGVMAAHGAQKLFVYGFGGVTGAFAGMGVPLPGITGPLVALVEFLGGLALAAGLLTRVTAAGLAAVMLGAMLLVHLPGGFFAPNGIEFALTLFVGALALVFTGAGRYSLDHAFAARRGER